MFFKELSHLSRQKDRKLRKNHLFFEEKAPLGQFGAPKWAHIINIIKLQVSRAKIPFIASKIKFPRSRYIHFKMATIIYRAQCAQIAKYWKKF